MARVSPLLDQLQRAEPAVEAYGPHTEDADDIVMVQTFGPLEAEYGALRKGAVLLDQPHRATLEATGPDRLDFLNRMLTQELKGFADGEVRRAFWLNRKGRIDADLRLLNLPGRLLIDVDAHAARTALDGLSAYIITEDVTLADRTGAMHRLALHGPAAAALLAAVVETGSDAVAALAPGRIAIVRIAGAEVVVDRWDTAGEIGLELLVPTAAAVAVYNALLQAGSHPERPLPGFPRLAFRPAGWAAWNIARIEAGTPVFLLDFSPDNLPAETGVLDDRVSFKKGCYLGQEIVARMHALGAPKQRLVALRVTDPAAAMRVAAADPTAESVADLPRQPESGAPVHAPGVAEPVGRITSSTFSPRRSGQPSCFAMLRSKHAAPGSALEVEAEGARLPCVVQARLDGAPA